MSREIHAHKTNNCNQQLSVEAIDGPGPGNASHHYFVGGYDSATNAASDGSTADTSGVHILFQNGPINEDGNGVNGVTNEALLAIVLDRLEGFQTGPYKCRENALAITKIEEAMHWLHHRTLAREQRGVEGTHAV